MYTCTHVLEHMTFTLSHNNVIKLGSKKNKYSSFFKQDPCLSILTFSTQQRHNCEEHIHTNFVILYTLDL